MKVIIEIPKSAVGIAAMLISDSYSVDVIEKATKACEDKTVVLDFDSKDITEDMIKLQIALAVLAIGTEIEEQRKESDMAVGKEVNPLPQKSGLAERLKQMQEERQEIIEQQNKRK